MAAFAPYPSPPLTEIYAVGASSSSLAPALRIGTDSVAPTRSTYLFPADSDQGRIFVPGSGASLQQQCVTFLYLYHGSEPLSLDGSSTPTVLHRSETWVRSSMDVSFPESSQDVSTIDVKTLDRPLELRDVVSSPEVGPCPD